MEGNEQCSFILTQRSKSKIEKRGSLFSVLEEVVTGNDIAAPLGAHTQQVQVHKK